MLTAGSLFSGIAAPELAFERCGITTLWASEIDKQAASVHARHFPRTYQLGDIRHVGKHNAAPVDIVVGGSPCQDLSVAGNRAGLAGARSGLFHEYIRVIRELRPTFAIWENVPGARSSQSGRDFAAVLRAFQECGALDIAYRTFDAQHFNVPQRRERIFLVADFRGYRAGEILFEPQSVDRYRPSSRKAGIDIGYSLTTGNQRLDASSNETFIGVTAYDARNNKLTGGVTPTLQTQGRTVNQTPLICFDPRNTKSGDVTPTLKSHGQGGHSATNMPLVAGTLRGGSAGRRFSEGNYGDNLIPVSGYRVRRLMPVECERLMGFPDNWTRWNEYGAEMADTPRYRMLGNSIAVPIMEWIARRIVEVLR